MGQSMKLGGGGRFEAFKKKVEGEGKSPETAAAISASAGRKKYGNSVMTRLAQRAKK